MNELLKTYILDELLVVLETDPLGFVGNPVLSWEITNIFELTNLYQVHISYLSSTGSGQATRVQATRVVDKPKILQKFRNEQLKKLNI
jgi:hypothetical protein